MKKKRFLYVGVGVLSSATLFCISTPQVFAATSNPGTITTTHSGVTLTYFKGTPATVNKSSTISPEGIVGPAGYEFLNYSTQASNAFVQQAFSRVNHNTTSTPAIYIWTGSVEVSASASASASLGGGWGPINASLGLNADTSVSHDYSYEAKMTIPAHGYGWYEFGYAHSQWYGDYAYVNEYGQITSNEWLTVNSPRYNEMAEETSMTPPTNP
ncbi:hypothetical protein [Alicyclobacillus sp. SP_1]|uniref:hypothetical protein n=1 Tax=Alicyclobacillus sp. SP_1 TaxID=2942475 RepID=UPI00215808FA|nr:hypothetical protein [Alicyclobacillus sp. SP_1]